MRPREGIVSDPFLGEIKMWSFAWAPRGWALCDGAMLTVQQNQALFALLGINFGGNGQTTFALPDLRGRTPVGYGRSSDDTTVTYAVGNSGGAETVTLTPASAPPHAHTLAAFGGNGTAIPPTAGVMANLISATSGSTTDFSSYLPSANWSANATMAADSVSIAGTSTPHANMQPFTVVNFTICTSGSFPPRN